MKKIRRLSITIGKELSIAPSFRGFPSSLKFGTDLMFALTTGIHTGTAQIYEVVEECDNCDRVTLSYSSKATANGFWVVRLEVKGYSQQNGREPTYQRIFLFCEDTGKILR